MGRRNKQEQVSQQTQEPWGPSQPYFEDVMSKAQGLYDAGIGQQYYPGQTYVPLDTSSLDQMAQIAQQGNPNLQAGQNALNNVLTGSVITGQQYLEPTARGDYLAENNPYIADMYQRGADDLTNRMKTIAVGSGRYGSDWFGDTLGQNLGNLYSSIYAPAYEAERGRQLEAAGMLGNLQTQNANSMLGGLGLLPTMDAMRYADSDRLAQIAQVRQANEQAARNADIDRFNFYQQAPWQALGQYGNMLTLPNGGVTTNYQPAPGLADRGMGALLGAGTGFQIGNTIFPGIGGLIGGGLGGLLGFF